MKVTSYEHQTSDLYGEIETLVSRYKSVMLISIFALACGNCHLTHASYISYDSKLMVEITHLNPTTFEEVKSKLT